MKSRALDENNDIFLDRHFNRPAIDVVQQPLATSYLDPAKHLRWAPPDTPRYQDGVLLLELAATNSIVRSQEFDNAAWGRTRSNVTANALAAPDGTLTADKFVVDNTPASTHRIFQVTPLTLAIGDPVTVSIYLKAAELQFVYLQLTGGGATAFVASNGRYFDMVNGVAGFGSAGSAYTITPLSDGWFRISHTALATKAGTVSFEVYAAYALTSNSITGPGDGVSGFYPWGAQAEQGTEPSSYIPTSAAAVLRPADVLVSHTDAGIAFRGNIQFVADGAEVVQHVRSRLLFYLGECSWAVTSGVPYFTRIFVKPMNLAEVEAILKTVIIQTPGVNELLDFKMGFNSTTRKLAVAFEADTIYGVVSGATLNTFQGVSI